MDSGRVLLISLIYVDPQRIARVLVDCGVGDFHKSATSSALIIVAVTSASSDVISAQALHVLGSDEDSTT